MNTLFYLNYLFHKFLTNEQFCKIGILYKNKDIIMIEKGYDLKVNSNFKEEVTVQTLMKQLYPSLANSNLSHEYYFPHRLDFATSGVMCIPIHKEACREVSKAFSLRTAKKYYIAIVKGIFSSEFIDLELPIGEDIRDNPIYKMCSADNQYCSKPRFARTIFCVLEEGLYDSYPATKVLIRPVTGRRHQIRVHCSYLGHTIVGDYTYSNKKDIEPMRMFLHSLRLLLPMPEKNVDVHSADPFLNIKQWIATQTRNELNIMTYDKLETFV